MTEVPEIDRNTCGSPLISAQDLKALLGRPDLRLFDIRGRWGSPPVALREDYLAGHIPGAVFLDWTREFLQQDVTINLAAVAAPEEAAVSFERLGISDGDHVVLYDDYHHMLAGRVWWAMRYLGFEKIQVLNGGWTHWASQSLPTATEIPDAARGRFKPVLQNELRIDVETLIAEKDACCLLDGRGPVGYAGHPDDPRSGHIPGAINLPYSAILDETTGLFLDDRDLAARLDAAAPDWRRTRMISSCGSGYAGTVPMLAMAHLGISSSLYDGSMSEWKQDPARPVEQSC